MERDTATLKEAALEAEIVDLRTLLTQAGVDAARIFKQAGIDATENEAAKRVQHLLLEELHHRVKNTLATVIAITSQSLRTAASLDEGRAAVESRLVALGRAHDLLLQAHWTSAKLSDVIRSAIEPFDSNDVPRFTVQDIPLNIDPKAVLPITMSLNELCTNAVKYGALSNPTGRIEIASTTDETILKLTWTEKGGPPVKEPVRPALGPASSTVWLIRFTAKCDCNTSPRDLCMRSIFLSEHSKKIFHSTALLGSRGNCSPSERGI